MHIDTECRPNSEEAKFRRGQIQKKPNSDQSEAEQGPEGLSRISKGS